MWGADPLGTVAAVTVGLVLTGFLVYACWDDVQAKGIRAAARDAVAALVAGWAGKRALEWYIERADRPAALPGPIVSFFLVLAVCLVAAWGGLVRWDRMGGHRG